MRLRALLIDIDGVLLSGGSPVPRAAEALRRIRAHGLGLRLITNTTRQTRHGLWRSLRAAGFDLQADEVLTGAGAARELLLAQSLRPCLLVHPDLLPEFDGIPTDKPNAVVVGDAGEAFGYETLNRAFRVLADDPQAPLIALAMNRYFRAADGLSLDAGPFVAALEYASRRKALVTGKPAAPIFRAALEALAVAADEALMVGDDVEADIGGAAALGIRTALVRTGKYRAGDEGRTGKPPDVVADDFHDVVVRCVGETDRPPA